MASLLENLIDVLGRETQEYETLVTFAEQKTPAIVKGDIESLKDRKSVV